MSKEFSSDCKRSQNKLSFTSLCLCERCECPHASCLPRDKLCQHISTIFQPFSAFSIPHSNSNHLVSPFPRVLHLSKHSSCTSLLSINGFPRNHTKYSSSNCPIFLSFDRQRLTEQEKCWCPFRTADGDWGDAEIHMKSELLEMAQTWGL